MGEIFAPEQELATVQQRAFILSQTTLCHFTERKADDNRTVRAAKRAVFMLYLLLTAMQQTSRDTGRAA